MSVREASGSEWKAITLEDVATEREEGALA